VALSRNACRGVSCAAQLYDDQDGSYEDGDGLMKEDSFDDADQDNEKFNDPLPLVQTSLFGPSTSAAPKRASMPAIYPKPLATLLQQAPVNPPPAKKSKVQPLAVIPKFDPDLSSDKIFEMDLAMAKFFFGCNIPFSVADSSHFKTLMQSLRPDYPAPTMASLSTTLLETVVDEIKGTEMGMFNVETDCVLLLEAGRDPTDPILTTLRSTTGCITYIDSYFMTDITDLSARYSKIVKTAAEYVQSTYNAKFYGVVAPLPLQDEHLIQATCTRQAANRIMGKMADKSFVAQVTQVISTFLEPKLHTKVLELGGQHLISAGPGMWVDLCNAMKRILINFPVLKLIVLDFCHEVDAPIVELVEDTHFLDSLERAVVAYEPICELIELAQERDTSLADIVERWLAVPMPTARGANSFCDERQHVLNKYALAANFLHPGYRGRQFTAAQVDAVEEYLITVLPNDGLNDLMAFKQADGLFGTLFAKNMTSPVTFWNFAARKYEQLAKLALKLLQIPASGVVLNRPTSWWVAVHERNKEKLGVDNWKDLMHCYCALKMDDAIETDDF
jgi:hypothetical protein